MTDDDRIKRLERDKQVLLSALEFYGRKSNYEDHKYWVVVIDSGETARKAIDAVKR